MNEVQKKSKTLTGIVVGNKMDKTISVRIERTVQHPLYEKILKRTTKLLAHDEKNECNEGDEVIIESYRPISKNKSWVLQKIINRAQKV
ncbi:MAG: 30S ribosomal protein S17 [Gammaproteobacteria bacterium RIFCSPLOWO2_02_FULL_56_15]|nr:MAG: 30S ribosomal protein S17 [Gammaproteobacteria bacterium RIFCSPLOWO2_02_FULL_56_15]